MHLLWWMHPNLEFGLHEFPLLLLACAAGPSKHQEGAEKVQVLPEQPFKEATRKNAVNTLLYIPRLSSGRMETRVLIQLQSPQDSDPPWHLTSNLPHLLIQTLFSKEHYLVINIKVSFPSLPRTFLPCPHSNWDWHLRSKELSPNC